MAAGKTKVKPFLFVCLSLLILGIVVVVCLILFDRNEEVSKGKQRKAPSVTVSVSPTEESQVTPTLPPEETPTPTENPTPTPTDEPDGSEILLYSDLTSFLDRPAAELLEQVKKEYTYQYWELDYYIGTSGGFFFEDDMTMFELEDGEATLDPSCNITVIAVYQLEDGSVSRCIGRDLYTDMSFSELMEQTGNRFELREPGIEYEYYSAVGRYRDFRYLFIWWDEDPRLSGKAPDVSYVTKTGIRWIDN